MSENQNIINNQDYENEEYLTSQIITYIGNKRSLLSFIGKAVDIVRKDLDKDRLEIVDMFSGSGIVARYLKQYSSKIIANDLENYSYTLNKCYLSNKSDLNMNELISWYNYLKENLSNELCDGIISKMYAPKDINNIKIGERCFYTTRNAKYIDTARKLINNIPEEYRVYFIAPLLTEASVKNNTSGVFKGFYKNSKTGIGQFGGNACNALSRIKKDIELLFPIFSNYYSDYEVYKEDANDLVKKLDLVDLIYMDPPYNQHPYGSNYFMLNIINDYNKPNRVSKVSGIPVDWNRSKFNQSREALDTFENLCKNAKARYLLISFNSDGFIKKNEMINMLSKIGKVTVMEKRYNTFRGSRNLNNRNIYIKEYLYLVEVYRYKEDRWYESTWIIKRKD
mgnify:FL=1